MDTSHRTSPPAAEGAAGGESIVMDRPTEVMHANAAHAAAAGGTDPFDSTRALAHVARLRGAAAALWALGAGLALAAAVAFASGAVSDAYARLTGGDASDTSTSLPAFLPHLLQPTPAAGSVTVLVMSQPGGAEVWVNGRPRGLTPAVFNVDCGPAQPSLALDVRLAGHAPWKRRIACRAGANLRFDASLATLRQRGRAVAR